MINLTLRFSKYSVSVCEGDGVKSGVKGKTWFYAQTLRGPHDPEPAEKGANKALNLVLLHH